MGASKREFEEMRESELDQYVKMNLSKEDYFSLPEDVRLRSDFTIETRHDYSSYPEYIEQKKVCDKEYRKLSKIKHKIAVNKNVGK